MSQRPHYTRWLLASALAGAFTVVISGVQAQSEPAGPTPAPAPAAAAPAAGAQPAAPAPDPNRLPDAATITKDMTAVPGLITLYRANPNDPKADSSKLLAVIPRSLMKQDLLLAISGSKGAQAGFQGDSYLVRFEMSGRKVILAVPEVRYVQNPASPVNDAVVRTYTSDYLGAMPVIAQAGGDPLVDLSAILMSGLGMPNGQPPRRDVSEYSKVKSFPDNVLIDCDMAVGMRGMGWETVGVSFSLRRLPDARGFTPRIADERVGYFTTTRMDWNAKLTEPELMVRYINRWDIKKKDPSLELSPPDKPIVFIIEKTVPLAWRKYVADGALDWNKAFEKLGITGAVIVQQQTDDNEYANVDPEDARYNFIRWIVTGRAFAMGPSRADPRTGQILDADIIFDDSMLRVYHEQTEQLPPVPSALGPDVAKFLLDNPQFIPQGMTAEEVRKAAVPEGEMLYNAGEASPRVATNIVRQHIGCNYAQGLQQQLGMLQLVYAAQAPGKKVPDRILGEIIKQVVTHEVGHCIGLRHNFKASAWLGLDEIRRRRDTTDDATCASIMDYIPLLMFKGDQLEKLRHITTPTVGPYDVWAVEYGYKQPGSGDGDEKKMLSTIGSQSTTPDHAYLTDEDTMGLSSTDPLSNRFDMSNDVISWSKQRVDLADSILKDIRKTAVKENEPNYYLMRAYSMAMHEKYRDAAFISRIVGGVYFSRNRSSDANAKPPMVLVEPRQQRLALTALGETIFKDDFLMADPDLLNALVPTRWPDWSFASVMTQRVDYPAHQMIARIQAGSLLPLCNPIVLQRVYDAELKSKSADKFTAAELVTGVRNMIWTMPGDGEKFTDAKPALSSIRRNLQRQHMEYLLALVDSDGTMSPDLQAMCRQAAQDLSDQIGAVIGKAKDGAGSKLDFATRAHLAGCKNQIDRVLNAPYMKPQPYRGGGMIMIGQPGPG